MIIWFKTKFFLYNNTLTTEQLGRATSKITCKLTLVWPYHWRVLPQVSFLSRQTRVCRDKQVFVTTKHVFCHNYFFDATKVLSRQQMCYVVTNTCLLRQKYSVATNIILLRQAYFCRNKRRILSRKTRVCRNNFFVGTKMILVAAAASVSPDIKIT